MRRTTAALSALLISVGLASCSQNQGQNDGQQQGQNLSERLMPQQSQDQQQSQQPGQQSAPSQQSPAPSPSVQQNQPGAGGLKPDLSEPTPPSGPYEKATVQHPARNVPIPQLDPNIRNDKAGVKEVVRYFMASQEYIRQTGNARPLTQVAPTSCAGCWVYASSANYLTYSKGSWYVGKGIEYKERTLQVKPHPDRPGQVVATFDFFENEVTLVENGKPQVVASPNTFRSTMVLEYDFSLDKWIIRELENRPR
ncbi:DUF6318 family protein [Pseudoglutamicibacter albus]|uniref:DUF6318 family protein n=1 Tax=Pseudoglutamicibacter albus TaxID=98671 RepID=UPI001EF51DCE|nr:DUF6318 family protein [Pseudoglutamicibacter albus]MCG7303817.1 DUF6318 family protein [Pseudoglutamicibacter albus]